MYEAFRKITDYFYLDDINVLESISDSTEMLEIIRLAKLYKLNDLFRAAEIDFSDTMFNWLETSSVFSLKPENVGCKDSSVEKDSGAHFTHMLPQRPLYTCTGFQYIIPPFLMHLLTKIIFLHCTDDSTLTLLRNSLFSTEFLLLYSALWLTIGTL